jgi:hypothetical protein
MEMTREVEKKLPFFSLEAEVKNALQIANLTVEQLDFEIRKTYALYAAEFRRNPTYQLREDIEFTAYEGFSAVDIYDHLSEAELEFFSTLSESEKDHFLFFSGANYMWDWGKMLTERCKWADRYGAKQILPVWKERLPLVFRLIELLPFEYTGRIMLMGTSPHQKVYRHIDAGFDEPVIDTLIMSFQREPLVKKVFMEDAEGRALEVPYNLAYCIDDSFPHYLEAKPYFTYGVRIEGKFKPGVRKEN